MIELSQDSVDNKNNESLENKLEEIVSEINKSISEDIKGLDISQLEDMQKDLKELPYISHEEFKQRSQKSRAIIRTGECTPYANIILVSGVIF